jgi:preprotein translocase subunit SecE
MVDKIKLAIAGLLVAVGCWGYYHWSESALILRVLMVLAGVAAAAVIAWTSSYGKRFVEFSHESYDETRKVVWPSRKETLQTTGIVFVFVVVMALFLWLVDAGLFWVVQLIMGRSA